MVLVWMMAGSGQETLLLQDNFNRPDSSRVGGEWRIEQDGITGCLIPFPYVSIQDSTCRFIVGYDDDSIGGTGKARIKKEYETMVITRVAFDFTPIRKDTLPEIGIGVHIMYETTDYFRYGIKYFCGDTTWGYNDVYEDSTVPMLDDGEWDGTKRSVNLDVDSILNSDFSGVFDRDSIASVTVSFGLHANECYSNAEATIDNIKIYGYELSSSMARHVKNTAGYSSSHIPLVQQDGSLRFFVEQPGLVRLDLIQSNGVVVSGFFDRYCTTGSHAVSLSGEQHRANGHYLCRLTYDGRFWVIPVVIRR